MIVDLRIYTCLPNKVAEFVALYEAEGWPIQLKYLENCVGWYTTVEGALNTVVHMWGYADQGDRERRRAAMAADPAWQAYLKKVGERGLLLKMENRIIRPTPFFEAHRAARAG
ncbi:NIPSNAP family protein [Caldovatus aquaticus]|uniref:NIPSNAP family protein n=1 Tax=Caldovatus aquaticus TaxID=2865671 RepID=A0ABS7F636_9PROT|nr:NIPSNAP family protein [Caldovatus aquaticus]MBW8271083.1 NIPSNAP family protein [Caldovatus aquaticus]